MGKCLQYGGEMLRLPRRYFAGIEKRRSRRELFINLATSTALGLVAILPQL